MHGVTFQLKRAHLGAVAFGKKVLQKVKGMTPARYDLLFLIHQDTVCPYVKRLRGYAIRQDRLWKELGLHASTISKMVKRLVEMGWISKERKDPSDARSNTISLTSDGLRAIVAAMRRVARRRKHVRHFVRFFSFSSLSPGRRVESAIAEFFASVEQVARSLGDSSSDRFDYGLDIAP